MATDELYGVLSPLLARAGLELVDLEIQSGLVRVTVDCDGGVDLDGLARANQAVSTALDELDPLPGRYTLEVTSPGIERRLRTPAHFARAVGQTVSVRTNPGVDSVRRVTGHLVAADDQGVELVGPEVPNGALRLGYGDIERARTIFERGASPAPSPSRSRGSTSTPRPRAPGRGPAATDTITERVTP